VGPCHIGPLAARLWHTRETRKDGETEARLYQLDAWRESPLYSPRERAAIAWTDALTCMDRRDMDEAYDLVAVEFTLDEQVRLNMLIGMINSVNPRQRRFCRRAASHGGRPPGRLTGPRQDAAASFEPHRPRLIRLAYRMLGSVADAEDVVQDAFLRWLDADRATVAVPEAYLVRIVTRLCLDVLKSTRRRRETYIGPWLPEPLVEAEADADIDDDVTLPLLIALERLSPLERAAFLLHDVFGMPFDDVGASIGRDAAAARQLATRARQHVHEARPRFAVDRQKGLDLAAAFFCRLAQRRSERSRRCSPTT
jgi:RNA polymerase sigma factor (sigma-70 family)